MVASEVEHSISTNGLSSSSSFRIAETPPSADPIEFLGGQHELAPIDAAMRIDLRDGHADTQLTAKPHCRVDRQVRLHADVDGLRGDAGR